MRADNIGALRVGENDRLVGMVTDRDIAMRAVAEERPTGNTAVREVMSEHVYYCFEDDDVEQAASVMAEHQVHRPRIALLALPARSGRRDVRQGTTHLGPSSALDR